MDINFLAVIVAAILSFVIGSVWYSQKAFGKKWMELTNLNSEDFKKNAKGAMAGTILGGLVLACILAVFVGYANVDNFFDGALVGFWAWLGFVVTTSSSSVLFERRPIGLFLMNIGFHLVEFVLMGALLAIWR